MAGRDQLTFYLWKSPGFCEWLFCLQREEGPSFPCLKATYYYFSFEVIYSRNINIPQGKFLVPPLRYSLAQVAHMGLVASITLSGCGRSRKWCRWGRSCVAQSRALLQSSIHRGKETRSACFSCPCLGSWSSVSNIWTKNDDFQVWDGAA